MSKESQPSTGRDNNKLPRSFAVSSPQILIPPGKSIFKRASARMVSSSFSTSSGSISVTSSPRRARKEAASGISMSLPISENVSVSVDVQDTLLRKDLLILYLSSAFKEMGFQSSSNVSSIVQLSNSGATLSPPKFIIFTA